MSKNKEDIEDFVTDFELLAGKTKEKKEEIEITPEEEIEQLFLELDDRLANTKWDWIIISNPDRRRQYEQAFKRTVSMVNQAIKIDSTRGRALWNKYAQFPYGPR